MNFGYNPLNLDSAVRSTHLTQPIDSPSIIGKHLTTNKVAANFPITLDKSIDYTMHALPTAEFRLKILLKREIFEGVSYLLI
jgi:hypothetical protein